MRKIAFKLGFFFGLSVLVFVVCIKWLDTFNITLDKKVTKNLLEDSNHLSDSNFLVDLVEYVVKLDVLAPKKLLVGSSSLVRDEVFETTVSQKNPNSSTSSLEEEPVTSLEEVKEEVKETPQEEKEDEKPIIYIYNTHQTEKYQNSNNKTYSVLDASYFLQDELKKYGLLAIVEENSVSDILNTNQWNYANSYRVTKMFLEEVKKEYPTVKYYIDLHRDSVSRSATTVKIGEKTYARTLFVLGLENENYKKNLAFFEEFEQILNKNYPKLSRGIYKKQGAGVNGVYNQDFSKNTILIEVGGYKNTFGEVKNTLRAIAYSLDQYIDKES